MRVRRPCDASQRPTLTDPCAPHRHVPHVLDMETIKMLLASGHSRIPVYVGSHSLSNATDQHYQVRSRKYQNGRTP